MKKFLITLSILFTTVYLIGIKKIVVGIIYLGGLIVAPEASKILYHYTYGNGEKMVLDSDYIKNSPVILKHLKTLKVGESKRVGFKQNEDWRLSYAINGFTLTKFKDKAVIEQKINFSGNEWTELNLYLFKIKVSDGIVNEFDTKPFLLYHEFPLEHN
jgi:hypothetical protein